MADNFVRLVDGAHVELEGEALGHAGLAQQTACFCSGFLDIRPVAGDLLELLPARGQGMTRKNGAAHGLDDGDPREVS